MARLLTESFEAGDGLFWTSTAGGGINTNATYCRSGNRSWGCSNAAYKNIPTLTEAYFRFPLHNNNRTEVKSLLFRLDTTLICEVRINLINRIEIWFGGTLRATSSITFPANSYSRLEIHVRLAVDGIIEARLDNKEAVVWSGNTSAGIYINNFGISLSYIATIYVDDIALNDTSGSVDNSWCGNGYVVPMAVTGNGDSSQLTGSDGNSTDNYLLVDEVPPNATDYVEGSVVDQRDLYQLANVSLPAGMTVSRVIVESRSMDTAGLGGLIALEIKTVGTEYLSADMTLAGSYAPIRAEWTLNPATGLAWTQSDLDTLQAGVRTRS